MLQLGRSPAQASHRKRVTLQVRTDLIIKHRTVGGKGLMVIKDPITLEHFFLLNEEFALLKMLDGKRSYAEMKELFEMQFERKRLDLSRLELLHAQFYRNGLIVSNATGQGQSLASREVQAKLENWNSRLKQWLAIRMRGINPDRFLEHCDARLGWIFSKSNLMLVSVFLLFTIAFMTAQSSILWARLPKWNEYLNASNVFWLLMTFVGFKIVHELGHALACKHFGADCHEMGILFLVFTPCLYCDVSDSWMIDSKWERAAVAASGVVCEMILAAACAWIWWISFPGTINSLCLNAMFVGGVGTFVVNANPLLRYDGYFVLSDLLETPNLWQQSKQYCNYVVRRFFFREPNKSFVQITTASPGLLWTYGLLSSCYRWVLSIVVLWIVYKTFQSLKLELVGVFLVGSVLCATVFRFSFQAAKLVHRRNRRHLRGGRVATVFLLVASLLGISFFVPLPARVHAPLQLHVLGASSLVVLVDGHLVHSLVEGTSVKKGDVVAVMDSPELRLELAIRLGQLAQQSARLAGLESRRGQDSSISAQIPTVREAIAGLQSEVARLQSEAEQLKLISPIDGVVLAPDARVEDSNPEVIEFWRGTPLQTENLGSYLKRGTLVCKVGSRERIEGTAYLTQSQVELARAGQSVTLKTVVLPGVAFQGRIVEVASTREEELPSVIFRSGQIPGIILKEGRMEALDPIYVAIVSVDIPGADQSINELIATNSLHHALANAAIQVDSRTLFQLAARLFHETIVVDPRVQR